MKKTLITIFALAVAGIIPAMAQITRTQTIENGGPGPYKAQVVEESSFNRFTFYRPVDMKAAVDAEGKLPVILYANGGCRNDNVQMRLLLNNLASQGYVAAAIGPYDEVDVSEHWAERLAFNFPTGKKVILANGKEVLPMTDAERKKIQDQIAKEMAQARNNPRPQGNAAPQSGTYPKMLLEVLDWLIDRNADPKSEYYHMLDLDKVAVMGQSCGGAQAMSVSHDPRIKTTIMLNSGMGGSLMQGSDKGQLDNLHAPILYLVGGEIDVATPNAEQDFANIKGVPVAFVSTFDGHSGTYYETNGGEYAKVVLRWLNWHLKGNVAGAGYFLDDSVGQLINPGWTFMYKNF